MSIKLLKKTPKVIIPKSPEEINRKQAEEKERFLIFKEKDWPMMKKLSEHVFIWAQQQKEYLVETKFKNVMDDSEINLYSIFGQIALKKKIVTKNNKYSTSVDFKKITIFAIRENYIIIETNAEPLPLIINLAKELQALDPYKDIFINTYPNIEDKYSCEYDTKETTLSF